MAVTTLNKSINNNNYYNSAALLWFAALSQRLQNTHGQDIIFTYKSLHLGVPWASERSSTSLASCLDCRQSQTITWSRLTFQFPDLSPKRDLLVPRPQWEGHWKGESLIPRSVWFPPGWNDSPGSKAKPRVLWLPMHLLLNPSCKCIF